MASKKQNRTAIQTLTVSVWVRFAVRICTLKDLFVQRNNAIGSVEWSLQKLMRHMIGAFVYWERFLNAILCKDDICSSFVNEDDRHLKKLFRFIFDLSKIYGIHFLMIANPRFGMRAEPSFRNDEVYFDMTSPAFSFRKQWGFTSCHNEREYHFFLSFEIDRKTSEILSFRSVYHFSKTF